MKPKDFLEWYRYHMIGGKRMHDNYKVLRKHNEKSFNKLVSLGKFKYDKEEEGTVLEFPVEEKCEMS